MDMNALPGLVIRGIRLHLVAKKRWTPQYVNEFKKHFYFLQVSSRWRRLGTPLVYKTALSVADYLSYYKSNIGLISEFGMEHLAKEMGISFLLDYEDFPDLLEPLFNIFNLGGVDWPEEYDLPPSKNLLSKMPTLVQCLAACFSYVLSLDITLDMSDEIVKQLTNQIMTTFSNGLVSLTLDVNTPVDLGYLLASFRHLNFKSKRPAKYSFPKLRNPSAGIYK